MKEYIDGISNNNEKKIWKKSSQQYSNTNQALTEQWAQTNRATVGCSLSHFIETFRCFPLSNNAQWIYILLLISYVFFTLSRCFCLFVSFLCSWFIVHGHFTKDIPDIYWCLTLQNTHCIAQLIHISIPIMKKHDER